MSSNPERELSNIIVSILQHAGYHVYSTDPQYGGIPRRSAGIPDLIVMGLDRHAYVEIKMPKRYLTKAQRQFKTLADAAGIEHHVWKHPDQAKEWINEHLQGNTRRTG